MTINTIYAPVSYNFVGVGPYEFEFDVISADTVVVQVDGVTVSPGLYTVALTGQAPIYSGGSITLDGTVTGSSVTILRSTRADQQVDYVPLGPFPAEVNEFALDKLTMITQELAVADVQPPPAEPGGPYLPLAGGVMSQGAAITFRDLADRRGQVFFGDVLTAPAFWLRPAPGALNDSIGYLFEITGNTYMAGGVDGTWALFGRPELSTLDDNALVIKSDLDEITGGASLPLAGGVMDQGADIDWIGANDAAGRMTFQNFLNVGTFTWQPTPGGANNDIGFIFQIDAGLTKTLAGDENGVWAITGRPDFADLPDNAIALKSDVATGGGQFLPLAGGVMDPGATITMQSGTPTTAPNGLVIDFDLTLGVDALTISTPTAGDIGYLFLTGQTGTPVLGANQTDGWTIGNQVYTDAEAIVCLDYADANYLRDAQGSIDLDGLEYVRQDGAWVVSTGGSGGEVNTASNLGSGAGLFAQKDATDLQFKSIIGGTDLSVVETADNITINFTGSGGGSFLPLTGGTMVANAVINFSGGGGFGAMSVEDFLSTPSFYFRPTSGTLGHVWGTSTAGGQPSMSLSVTNGLVVENQKTSNANYVLTKPLGDAAYAFKNHIHTISNVTGLQTALDGKAPLSHTHTISQITGLQTELDAKANTTDLNNYPTKAGNETITGIWTFSNGFAASVGVNLSGGAIMGNNQIQGVADGTLNNHAATVGQLNAAIAQAFADRGL